jgi:hypothetical protein
VASRAPPNGSLTAELNIQHLHKPVASHMSFISTTTNNGDAKQDVAAASQH